jgi:hypothetical protein
MIEPASIESLKEAIEATHGGVATFVQAVPVSEHFGGDPVWEGVVHIFDLNLHGEERQAYAWSSPIEGTDRRRIFAVLQIPPINTPTDAVRAAIVAEHRKDNGA